MPENISHLKPLSFDGSVAVNWKKFKYQFLNYIMAYYEEASNRRKLSMLLFHIGSEGREIVESFELTEAEKEDFKYVLKKLDNHLIPKENIRHLRYLFFTRRQEEGESYEEFAKDLIRLSKNCEFGHLRESLIKDIFVRGLLDMDVRQALLRCHTLDIDMALEACTTRVTIPKQMENLKIVEYEPQTVDKIKKTQEKINLTKCSFCGYIHHYRRCPAYGKTCLLCQHQNHFARVCRSRSSVIEVSQLCQVDCDKDYTPENKLVSSISGDNSISKPVDADIEDPANTDFFRDLLEKGILVFERVGNVVLCKLRSAESALGESKSKPVQPEIEGESKNKPVQPEIEGESKSKPVQPEIEDRVNAEFFRKLLEKGVLVYKRIGHMLVCRLAPGAGAFVNLVMELVDRLSQKNTWDDLKNSKSYGEFFGILFNIFAKMFIENLELMIRLALSAAQWFLKIFGCSPQKEIRFSL